MCSPETRWPRGRAVLGVRGALARQRRAVPSSACLFFTSFGGLGFIVLQGGRLGMLKKFYVMHPQFPPGFSPVKTRRKGNKLGRLVTVLLGKISVPLPRPAPFGDCLQEPNLAVPHTPRAPRREKRVGSSSAAASSRRKVGGAKGIDFGNIFRGLEALPASLPLRRAVPTCSRTICPKLEALQPRNKGLWSAQSHQFGTGGERRGWGGAGGTSGWRRRCPSCSERAVKKKKKKRAGEAAA